MFWPLRGENENSSGLRTSCAVVFRERSESGFVTAFLSGTRLALAASETLAPRTGVRRHDRGGARGINRCLAEAVNGPQFRPSTILFASYVVCACLHKILDKSSVPFTLQ
jgi:hypothetical protein